MLAWISKMPKNMVHLIKFGRAHPKHKLFHACPLAPPLTKNFSL